MSGAIDAATGLPQDSEGSKPYLQMGNTFQTTGVQRTLYQNVDFNQMNWPQSLLYQQIQGGSIAPAVPNPLAGVRVQLPDGDTSFPALGWQSVNGVGSGLYRVGTQDFGWLVNSALVTEWLASEFRVNYLTADSIVFVGAAGKLDQSNANLKWNASLLKTTGLWLSNTSNQIVMQSGGVTGTLTWTPTSSGKTITLPDATGTAAVSATSPITLSVAGDVGVTKANLAGTANQVILSASGTGVLLGSTNITLSLPQSIDTGAAPTFASLNLSGTSNQIVLQSAGVTGTLTWTPTSSGKTITFPDATGTVELTANKNASSGYAGLNSSSRITKGADTTDDLIVDAATKGLVLKDTAGSPHYWRVTVSALGVLTTSDLGTSKP